MMLQPDFSILISILNLYNTIAQAYCGLPFFAFYWQLKINKNEQ